MFDDSSQIKSYVWHHATGQCFFVSTIERDSSEAVLPTPRFMETIAWEYDWDTRVRDNVVAQTGGGPALDQHFDVCRQLYQTGKYSEDDDND